MDNYLKINDLVTFDFLNPDLTAIKDDFDASCGPFEKLTDADIEKLDAKGLKVRLAATHAGIVTRNNMFYLPDKMKKGAATFLEDYGKPVLKHHDEKEDAIGRVIDSVYVDTSGVIRDVMKDSAFSESSFRDFCDGKMPFSYQVDFVRKYLTKSIKDGKSLLENESYAGLGHVQIIADITDSDAIQKFLDGRYLTGSVGARTNKAICSICKQNWTESGPCVPPDTEIMLSDGSTKPIKDIRFGDYIVTHTGSIGKVTEIYKRKYQGNVVSLDRVGTNRPLVLTGNHPVLNSQIKTVSHRINKSDKRYFEKVLIESGWIPSEELYESSGYISVPVVRKKRSDSLSLEQMALLGLYAAEGSNSSFNCLEFSIHKDEVTLFDHYFKNAGVQYFIYDRENNKSVSCRFSSKEWKILCDKHVGHGSKTKRLSKDVVFASNEGIKSFLGAYIDGDGSLNKDQFKVKISTASKSMAHQILTMCHNIGIVPNLYESTNPGGPSDRDNKGLIYDIQISRSQVEQLVPYSVKLRNWKSGFFKNSQKVLLDGKIYAKYQYDILPYDGIVYNLEVDSSDNAHSYIANDISVHNCEHDPGSFHDEQKCVLIAGDFFYDEYSMVNSPADRQSRVLELYYNGNIKNIEVKNEFAGNVYEVSLTFPQYVKEETMKDKRAEENKEIKDSAEKKSEEVKDETKETEEIKVEPEVKSEEVEVKDEEKTEVKDETSEFSVEDALVQAVEKEEISDEDAEKLYDAMMEEFSDAKLSTEKRKNLRKSTFCGPDKSFPVPDCAHVTAARRLIGRYKGSGDKGKILACVDRKAKAMGCNKKQKDAVSHARVLQMLTQTITEHMYEKKYRENDGKDPVLSEEDVSALTAVMKNLVGMVGKDHFVASLSSEEQELKDVVKHFQDIDLLEEIISLEETMGELRDELSETEGERDALKEEYDLIQKDNDAIRDELVESKKQFRDSRVEKMSILTSLKDGEVSEEQQNEWISLTDEVLDTSLNKLEEEVDIKKMADKLNDGTSRNPQGEVEDPTLSFDSMPEDIKDRVQDIKAKAFKAFDNVKDGERWAEEQIALLLESKKDELWKDR